MHKKEQAKTLYLMAGKYPYTRGGASEYIKKDTEIISLVDLDNCLLVNVKGIDYGSLAVFDHKKILNKPRTRKIVYRKVPCNCLIVGWSDAEWMAGVPAYCKMINNGGACPLIKYTGNSTYKCNYSKARVKDYLKMCDINGIETEYITLSL